VASLLTRVLHKAFPSLLSPRRSIPAEWTSKVLSDLPLLSIDLELTTLNTEQAKVTSIGWVEGQNMSISLDSAFYSVVRASGDLAQSPVIHRLTAKDLAQGKHIADVVDKLSSLAKTHLWVLHNANLDMQVLQRVSKQLRLPSIQVLTIDTMLLERYLLEKAQSIIKQDALTLGKCRERYHLPDAQEHNALDDALATLTLLFAQHHIIDKHAKSSIGDLLHTRALRVFHLGEN
jgi:DNA polymerase-3 subunit epsilon